VFNTSHFSIYALVEVEPDEQSISPWIWVLIAIILLLLIVITILIVLKMKHSEDNDKNDNNPDGNGGSDGTKVLATETTAVKNEPLTVTVSPETRVIATVQTLPVVMEETEEAPADEAEVVDANSSTTVYNRSFSAKIMQAEDNIQAYYSELKNELLSYKGVKARMSWAYESFNKGRNHVAKFTIRGKTLSLYLALDPDKYNVSRYHHKDVSETARYATVPFMLKIKSDRAAKYAKELIAEAMNKVGAVKIDGTKEDYTMDRKSVVALIEDGYIKVKEVEKPNFDEINNKKAE
jgi:predicted transport protein